METLVEAIDRLRREGYELDLRAVPGARLRCGGCDEVVPAAEVTVPETIRFEGDSNPDDESILLAIVTPRGHRGLFSAAYGPDADAVDVEVLKQLAGR